MAFLVQPNLKADDCTEMILSMWFKLPEVLPFQNASDSDPETPTVFSHNYILMEWGGYEQAYWTAYYPGPPQLLTTISYDAVIPFLDPAKIGWFSNNLPFPDEYFRYGFLPGTPLGGDFGNALEQTVSPYPPVAAIVTIENEKRAKWKIENEDAYTRFNFITGGAWGLNSGTHTVGPPVFQPGSGGSSSEFWTGTAIAFPKFYNYFPPSTVSVGAITGSSDPKFNNTAGVSVNIGGAIFGPMSEGSQRPQGIATINPPWPGYTVVPRLQADAPGLYVPDPHNDVRGEPGTANNPYLMLGKWHHLLCCVKLAGPNMCEQTPLAADPTQSVARYLDNTMWLVVDGVPYGGTPWPYYDTISEQSEKPIIFDQNIFEGGEPENVNSRPVQYVPIQNKTCFTKHGIIVNGWPLHIPYNKGWVRTDLSDWDNDAIAGNYPDHYGWRGGDTTLNVLNGQSFLGPYAGQILWPMFPVPAMQLESAETPGVVLKIPPRTEDIKREYSDVQIWFGKYIDPTKYDNLKLFLEIFRDEDDGKLYGNIPALDDAARAAYAAAQANDPTIKVLSLAAAPNHLGTPDVYLAGGASSFIHDRGTEGDTMVKIGTINNTSRPSDIPIPESAVKPPKL